MKKHERKCVCEIRTWKVFAPICDKDHDPCASNPDWCGNIVKDGTPCAHDRECHQQQERNDE